MHNHGVWKVYGLDLVHRIKWTKKDKNCIPGVLNIGVDLFSWLEGDDRPRRESEATEREIPLSHGRDFKYQDRI